MIRNRFFIGLLIIPMMYMITGCYPDKFDYVDELDLVVTHMDENTDFTAFTTFSVLDTVVHVTDDDKDDSNFSRDHDQFIISELRRNMLDRGYTELESPDSINRPDIALLVSALSADFYYYYSYYPYYWGYYPGWGYPGWGYPGGGYPSYGGSYSTGTLVVDMWDTEAYDPDDEKQVGIKWTGVIDGVLSGSGTQTRARLDKHINQLFIQSPYLQK